MSGGHWGGYLGFPCRRKLLYFLTPNKAALTDDTQGTRKLQDCVCIPTVTPLEALPSATLCGTGESVYLAQ
jgi:hypothetical protein